MTDYGSLYVQKQLIGKGHYGRVFLIINKKSKLPYVAKKIELEGMSEQQRDATLKQIKIHKQLKHKNILEFREYFLQNECLIMIMDYCQFGDLSMYIKNRKETEELFDEPLIINLFVQMLFGLNYLHEHRIIHRDIKPQNIFIDSQGIIKIADFGISKMLQHTHNLASTIVGTPYYLSPQACSNKGYSFKSDIWSLGCVLYELCTLQYPFKGDNILLLAKKISTQQPPLINNQYSKQISALIKQLLIKNFSERPSIKQILQTKFISQYLIRFKIQDQNIQQYPIFQTQGKLENQASHLDLSSKSPYSFQQQIFSKNSSKYQSESKKQNKIDQIKISPKKSGIQNMRRKCIQMMGQQLFYQIYSLMKTSYQRNQSQQRIQQKLRKKYSKKQVEMSLDIAQLIYLQTVNK